MSTKFRITYATMSADNEELQQAYDEAAERMKGELGKDYPVIVNGEERWREDKYIEPSPIDHDVVIGRFSQATAEDVEDAVAAAKAFSLEWDRMGWKERVRILRNVANIMEDRLFDLAALMAYEVGKSRLEALGDVQETAELIRWNCDAMEQHDGFRTPMSGLGAAGDYYDVMRPYGVWAVISPFNFPMALSGGPSSGALVAGNCVVLKPSNQGALLGYKLYECYRDGGVPAGAFHLVVGRGAVAGEALWKHPDVAGVTFTGSYQVGMSIYREFATDVPKPVICEMGGKNPAIVTKNADLDVATDGVLRSAFGFGGQKCSACSRVFVEREVYDDFLGMLKEKTEKITGRRPDPARRLPRADHQRGRARHVRGGGGRGREERHARHRRLAHHRGRPGSRALRAAHDRRGPRRQLALEEGALRAVRHGRAVRRAGRRDREGERDRVRPHGGVLQHGPDRGRRVARPDPGGRGLREPSRRGHDRRVAGGAAVRRLEGAPARPARPAAVRTTSRCTCVSSRGR